MPKLAELGSSRIRRQGSTSMNRRACTCRPLRIRLVTLQAIKSPSSERRTRKRGATLHQLGITTQLSLALTQRQGIAKAQRNFGLIQRYFSLLIANQIVLQFSQQQEELMRTTKRK